MKDLAKTFNEDAALYDQMRPNYPKQIFVRLKELTKTDQRSQILEVGCGTGQATDDLIRISSRITCLEPGKDLIKIAKQKFPQLEFVNCKFEDYETTKRFDLIVSATAWHWIDEGIRYKKAYQLLKDSGELAIIYHYHIETDPNAFHLRAKDIYQRYLGSRDLRSREQIDERKAKLENDYFYLVDVLECKWRNNYTTDEYIKLRNTYSDHRSLNLAKKSAFEKEIRQFADKEYGGKITKSYTSVLFLCKKRRPKDVK